jgi:hypothetical protein
VGEETTRREFVIFAFVCQAGSAFGRWVPTSRALRMHD